MEDISSHYIVFSLAQKLLRNFALFHEGFVSSADCKNHNGKNMVPEDIMASNQQRFIEHGFFLHIGAEKRQNPLFRPIDSTLSLMSHACWSPFLLFVGLDCLMKMDSENKMWLYRRQEHS